MLRCLSSRFGGCRLLLSHLGRTCLLPTCLLRLPRLELLPALLPQRLLVGRRLRRRLQLDLRGRLGSMHQLRHLCCSRLPCLVRWDCRLVHLLRLLLLSGLLIRVVIIEQGGQRLAHPLGGLPTRLLAHCGVPAACSACPLATGLLACLLLQAGCALLEAWCCSRTHAARRIASAVHAGTC